MLYFNTLRPRQNGRHFADDIFKCIFLHENVWIPIKISLKFVPKGPVNNIPALVQIMAWCRPGDKPLSEPMMVSLTTHICVTRPQWVKSCHWNSWDALYIFDCIRKNRTQRVISHFIVFQLQCVCSGLRFLPGREMPRCPGLTHGRRKGIYTQKEFNLDSTLAKYYLLALLTTWGEIV